MAVLTLPLTGHVAWTLSGGDPRGERVLVTDVVDGDTIHVGRGWRRTTVRLKGVDTPETVHPNKPVQWYGPEATAFTRQVLTGKRVRLEREAEHQHDAYGRLLAYVFLDDGSSFNRELVRLGYARVYTRFPFRYADDFKQAQAEARQAGRGLWGRPATGPEPAHGVIIGNRRSRVYHVPGQPSYGTVSERNRIYFGSEEEAVSAGYRRALR
jgi:micrococcal nuclease